MQSIASLSTYGFYCYLLFLLKLQRNNCYCYPSTNKHIFAMGCTSSFMIVLTFADRISWSFPGNVSTTLAYGYFDLSMFSYAIITRSPSLTFCKRDVFLFVFLFLSERYTLIHFFQNMSVIPRTVFHFARRFVSFSVVAMNLWC